MAMSAEDPRRVDIEDRLFSPSFSTHSLDVTDGGAASFPGGKSSRNPEAWRTYFGPNDTDGRNHIRGDTDILGDVGIDGTTSFKGRVTHGSTAIFEGAKTAKNREGEAVPSNTAFPGPNGDTNWLSGNTHVFGDLRVDGGVESDEGKFVASRQGRNLLSEGDVTPNVMSLESGIGDGSRSALNFNGDSDANKAPPNPDKSRWRISADQGGDRDVMRIDQALYPGHPDHNIPDKNSPNYPLKTWVPVTIDGTTGKIRLAGQVELCDRDGKNCRTL